MVEEVCIEAVGRRGRAAALRFVVGGARDGPTVRSQADAMRVMARSRGAQAVRLWWARRKGVPVAAAIVLESPGRTGMLFFCPPDAPGVNRSWLARLVRAISRDAVERGMSMVQALVAPGDRAQLDLLAEGGLRLLAELVYMQRDLVNSPSGAPPAREDLTWRNYRDRQFGEAELADVIAATYASSLDCPMLHGVRQMRDVINGHKHSGAFRPEAWWIVSCKESQDPAGCILVNDAATTMAADVVYVGVVSGFRGRGIGSAMLRRAMSQACQRGRTSLSLAVDAKNVYALNVYHQVGFVETQRRLVQVML